MARFSLALTGEYFEGNASTLGELVRIAKQRMIQEDSDAPVGLESYRKMIRGMGELLSPTPQLLNAECREHAHLIQLLGDPLLRLPHPEKIDVVTPRTIQSGKRWLVRGTSPIAGLLTVELVYRRDRFRTRPVHRRAYVPSDAAFRKYQDTWEQAQNRVCVVKQMAIKPGAFELSLVAPEESRGDCIVRCMVNSPGKFALGASAVQVQRVSETRHVKQPPPPSVESAETR